MSIISKPNQFSSSTTIVSSQVNDNFDTIYNDYNGNISASNLASNAVTTAKITDANVTTAKLADGSVTAAKISTSAIYLTHTPITGNISTTATSVTQMTGFTASPTIPDGGRKVKITLHIPDLQGSGIINITYSIWDGTVGSGTQIAGGLWTSGGTSYHTTVNLSAIATPSAGSKTYNAGWFVSGGTGTINASSTAPAYFLVETI